jgi:hypothetical protein
MAKKRGKDRKTSGHPKEDYKNHKSFFSGLLPKRKTEYRKHEEDELRKLEDEIRGLETRQGISPKKIRGAVPSWFYMGAIFAAFLFATYISIFATLHFEDIEYMNITIVFLFISMVSFFLISAIFFISEKMKLHSIAPLIFFSGIVALMFYAFKAPDATGLVRYATFYAIIVAAVSVYVLAVRR